MGQTITLTESMRSNLSSLKSIQKQMDKTQERLSTGKKVNSAIDNASSYYQSRSLTNRASDLDALLDSMGQGIQTIQAANEGIEAVTSYVEQMKAVANTAATLAAPEAFTMTEPAAVTDPGNDPGEGDPGHDAWVENKAKYDQYLLDKKAYDDAKAESEKAQASYQTELDSYVTQFNTIREQAVKLVNDSSYQGVNLLKGNTLKVVFNESRGNYLDVIGRDITTAWTSLDDINESITNVTNGMTTLRSVSSELGNNYSIIQTRQDFTEALIDVLETGSDNLVLADMNEESANYLALQTRQQLAINSLSLASQSAQSILSLFN